MRIALAAVSVLVVSGTAGATIVPQRGIGGIALGMSRTSVESTLGKPVQVERLTTELGPSTTYTYPTLSVTFFAGPRVTSVQTRSRRERTPLGIGVGSSEARVAARVPGVRCVTESGYRHCYVGRWEPGRTITDFTISAGRVTRVTVGYVID